MYEPIVLPPLDASFAAWLATQPLMERNMREDLQIIRQCLRGRSPTEFVDGRDAAQRVRSVADGAGVVETASFYYQLYEKIEAGRPPPHTEYPDNVTLQ